MFAIDFKLDTAGLDSLINKLKTVANEQLISLAVATSLVGVVRDRIHTKGLDSNGAQIGTYSRGYMKVRTGNFGNSARKTKGKDVGGLKNSGNYSRGAKKGTSRPKYNRTNDTKVVLSLTRQMENDFTVVATDSNSFGLGYKNELNFKKSQWAEETYKKQIFALTPEEEIVTTETIHKYIVDAGLS